MSKEPNSPRVFSYLRFSTPEQSMGNSERRQVEMAERFAKKRGLEVDKSIRLADRGLSGFHGAHRKKGALGQFLELVEAGKIPSGSILLVENIDRLSREDFLNRFETVHSIITKGITIQTLEPPAEYTRDSLKGGMIYQLVGQMQRAHDESQRKSDMSGDNWRRKRNDALKGFLTTRRLPNWLKKLDASVAVKKGIKAGEVMEVIPEAADAIRMIFELKLKGLGVNTIVIKLNAEAPWRPKNGWQPSYVKKILQNPAVIGVYQPHQRTSGKRLPIGDPIPGYYPCIVDPELFYAVQEQLKANRGKGGRRDKCFNLFTHLVRCAYCGGTMRFVNKGEPPKGQQYLQCDTGYRGLACSRHRVRYDETEKTILENCHKLRPEQILPDADTEAERCNRLQRLVQGLDGQLADNGRQRKNLVDTLATQDVGWMRDELSPKLKQLVDQERSLIEQKDAAEREHVAAERSRRSLQVWTATFATLIKELGTSLETRRRTQAHLQEIIERIEIFAVGYRKRYDPNDEHDHGKCVREGGKLRYIPGPPQDSDDFEESMDDAMPGPKDHALRDFIKDVARRRMTKEGRFIRVFFKTGAVLDVVPEGSLASGEKLVVRGRGKRGWHFVTPRLDLLWDKWLPRDGTKMKTKRRTTR